MKHAVRALKNRQGETFTSLRGTKFTYALKDGLLEIVEKSQSHPGATRQSVTHEIPESTLDEILARWPAVTQSELGDLAGSEFVYAILKDPRVGGDEERVIQAFCNWLKKTGWAEIEREFEFLDVFARRGEENLYAEAKGRTHDAGTDLDILYGQLLRRMPNEEIGEAQFAVVVPTESLAAALRVPPRIRELLRIEIYEVTGAGEVYLRSEVT